MSTAGEQQGQRRPRPDEKPLESHPNTKRVQLESVGEESKHAEHGHEVEQGKKKKSTKGVTVAQSELVGLNFPISMSLKALKRGKYSSKVGAAAPVYLTAVLEYLVTEVLELAGRVAQSPAANRELARQLLQREGHVTPSAQRLLEQAARIAAASSRAGAESKSAEGTNAPSVSDITITPEHIQYILNNDAELKRLIETLSKKEHLHADGEEASGSESDSDSDKKQTKKKTHKGHEGNNDESEEGDNSEASSEDDEDNEAEVVDEEEDEDESEDGTKSAQNQPSTTTSNSQ